MEKKAESLGTRERIDLRAVSGQTEQPDIRRHFLGIPRAQRESGSRLFERGERCALRDNPPEQPSIKRKYHAHYKELIGRRVMLNGRAGDLPGANAFS